MPHDFPSDTKDDLSNFDDTSSSASNRLRIQSNPPSESSQKSNVSVPFDSTHLSDDGGISMSTSDRRSNRRPIPNSRYSKDFILPSNIEHLMRPFSPKRSYAPSDSDQSMRKQRSREKTPQKRITVSVNSDIARQTLTQHGDHLTKIGPLRLLWPRYRIDDAVYNGQHFSIFNTCPLDTGLFAVYHAYKAGGDAFRLLVEIMIP